MWQEVVEILQQLKNGEDPDLPCDAASVQELAIQRSLPELAAPLRCTSFSVGCLYNVHQPLGVSRGGKGCKCFLRWNPADTVCYDHLAHYSIFRDALTEYSYGFKSNGYLDTAIGQAEKIRDLPMAEGYKPTEIAKE